MIPRFTYLPIQKKHFPVRFKKIRSRLYYNRYYRLFQIMPQRNFYFSIIIIFVFHKKNLPKTKLELTSYWLKHEYVIDNIQYMMTWHKVLCIFPFEMQAQRVANNKSIKFYYSVIPLISTFIWSVFKPRYSISQLFSNISNCLNDLCRIILYFSLKYFSIFI